MEEYSSPANGVVAADTVAHKGTMHMRTLRRNRAVRTSAMKRMALSAAAGSAGVALVGATAPGRTAVAAQAQPTPPVTVALGGGGAPSPSATASPRPGFKTFVVPPCRPHVYYTIGYRKPVDMFIPHLEYIDGPGGEMEVWLKRFYLVRFHVRLEREVEGDFNAQDFTTKVRKMLEPEIEEEHAIEIGHEYVANIHDHHYGHLRYRVFGVRFGFFVWRVYHNCARLRVNSGTATFPTIREGWKYWETKSLHPRTTSRKVTKNPDQGSPEP